eukprot:259491_1
MQSIHCEKIGYPTTISGTVARYTEIRPKLIYRYLNTFPTWVIYTSDKVYSAFVSATNDTGEFVIEAIALLLADNHTIYSLRENWIPNHNFRHCGAIYGDSAETHLQIPEHVSHMGHLHLRQGV